MRGLPDREEAGDAVRSRSLVLRDSGFRLLSIFSCSCAARLLWPSFFCDGEELSITDASSPKRAFASALNFMGGTGISSSELSPTENFQGVGWIGPLTDLEARGTPRFKLGLDKVFLKSCRDIGLLEGS